MFDIETLLKSYGWFGLIGVGGLILVYKFLEGTIKKYTAKTAAIFTHKKEETIRMHEFFTSIDHKLNVIIPTMTVFETKPIRQALLRDLIYCSLASVLEVSNKIIVTDQDKWNHSQWTYEMLASMNTMNELFLNMCRERGIPEVVYTKYLHWYFKRLNYFRATVQQIGASEIYSTMELKTFSFFYHLSAFVSLMTLDAEQTLRELNGDITGFTYKNGIIEPLDSQH